MLIGISLNLCPALLKNLAIMKMSMLFGLCLLPLVFYELIVLYYTYKLRKVNKQMKKREDS